MLDFTKAISKKYIFPTVQQEEVDNKAKHPKWKQNENNHSCDSQITMVNRLFSSFLKLLKRLKLRDEWVLGLVDLALYSFFVDGLKSTQLIALDVVTWVRN